MCTDLAVGSKEPAGAPENEIEVTPAMIGAGPIEIYTWNRDDELADKIVAKIIIAALAKMPRCQR